MLVLKNLKSLLRVISHKTFGEGTATRVWLKISLILKRVGLRRFWASMKGSLIYLSVDYAAENHIVEAGLKAYEEKNNNLRDLRRDVHRLEKGITARSRRDVFGLEPCAAVLDALERGLPKDLITLQWAIEVLRNYFEAIKPYNDKYIGQVSKLKKRFNSTLKTCSERLNEAEQRQVKHFDSYQTGRSKLTELVLSRRSVRWYEDNLPNIEEISEALVAGSCAPSACNRLPYRFIIIVDDEKKRRVGSLAAGTSGWLDNIPCLVAVIGDWSVFADKADRKAPFIDASFAVMQALLLLQEKNISGCVINWKNTSKQSKKAKSELFLKDYERVLMLISLGVHDGTPNPISRKKDNVNVVSIV